MLSLEKIERLAPDQVSLAAAKKLLKPGSWPTLGSDGQGGTIEQAAANKAIADCEAEADVTALAELVRACLLADLPQAADRCIRR